MTEKDKIDENKIKNDKVIETLEMVIASLKENNEKLKDYIKKKSV